VPFRPGVEGSVCFSPFFLSSSPLAYTAPRPTRTDRKGTTEAAARQGPGEECTRCQLALAVWTAWVKVAIGGDGLGRRKALSVRRGRLSRHKVDATPRTVCPVRAKTMQAIGAQSLSDSRGDDVGAASAAG
jgi:hypothetical protein